MSKDTPTTIGAVDDGRERITPPERAYIHLLRGVGMTNSEISEEVGRTKNTIQNLFWRSRSRVRDGENPIDVWEEIMEPLYEEDV